MGEESKDTSAPVPSGQHLFHGLLTYLHNQAAKIPFPVALEDTESGLGKKLGVTCLKLKCTTKI